MEVGGVESGARPDNGRYFSRNESVTKFAVMNRSVGYDLIVVFVRLAFFIM